MVTRQKVLIEMLRLARRPVQRVELVKWAFLLRHDRPSGGGSTFYDFVPCECGPCSFNLKHEIDHLAKNGCVQVYRDTWIHAHPNNCQVVPKAIQADLLHVIDRQCAMAPGDLLDYVYNRFPHYTMNSSIRRLVPRPLAPPGIYTAGYERLQIDGFLNLLVSTGIRRLIDVRNNPTARRYGYHKSTLSGLCGRLDIEYIHLPALGIASARRRKLDVGTSRDDLFDWYERTTLKAEHGDIQNVAMMSFEKPSVLVCMEANACDCHRSRLATKVAGLTGLGVTHLVPPVID